MIMSTLTAPTTPMTERRHRRHAGDRRDRRGMLRKSLCTPRANDQPLARARPRTSSRCACRRASRASRPVTSAVIAPRSRKIGRSLLKAYAIPPPNATRISSVDRRQLPVEPEEHAERDDAGDRTRPTSCTSPVPTRFRIPSASFMTRRSARRSGRVEVADRQPQDVLLHALPHVGDRALRGDAHHLRERERRRRLHQRRQATASARPPSRSARCCGSTRSMRNFELVGRTRPASRFTTISSMPTASLPRWAQTSSRASRQHHLGGDPVLFLLFG